MANVNGENTKNLLTDNCTANLVSRLQICDAKSRAGGQVVKTKRTRTARAGTFTPAFAQPSLVSRIRPLVREMITMRRWAWRSGSSALLLALGFNGLTLAQDSTTPPIGALPVVPDYVTGPAVAAQGVVAPSMSLMSVGQVASSGVIRVYKDFNAWWGEDRDSATLTNMGKVLGVDWFQHPVADCAAGIPPDTTVVVFTSNSFGWASTSANQSGSACQAKLADFLQAGGVLIVDMGDNDGSGGFMAPGSVGTPSRVFPSTCSDATLTRAAKGPDGILGTVDDHPMVVGPDGLAGSADDLNNENIDMTYACWVVHGNLEDGITLPLDATPLATVPFQSQDKAVLAEYCLGPGRVILDTFTKEYTGHTPPFGGATVFMTNLFSYALSPAAQCVIPVAVDVHPQSCPNPLNVKSRGVFPAAIVGTDQFDVTQVDPTTVKLEGVSALRFALEDVTAPFTPVTGKQDCQADCAKSGPDGMTDLTLKFSTQALATVLGDVADGQCRVLKLTGNLKAEYGGTPIVGEDVVLLRAK